MKCPLLTILTSESISDRTWCGNDETGKFTWHNSVPISPDPVSIKLFWKSNHGVQEHYIGTFDLHLSTLKSHGYIIQENSGNVRVKFINDNGLIKLALGHAEPFLVVGTLL